MQKTRIILTMATDEEADNIDTPNVTGEHMDRLIHEHLPNSSAGLLGVITQKLNDVSLGILDHGGPLSQAAYLAAKPQIEAQIQLLRQASGLSVSELLILIGEIELMLEDIEELKDDKMSGEGSAR